MRLFHGNKIEKNFLRLFILISLVPIILISTCSIGVTLYTVRKQSEQETLIQLKSIDGAVYEKTKKIQRFIDLLGVNSELARALTSGNLEELGRVMDRLSFGTDEIKGVIFQNNEKMLFPYKMSAENFDRLAIICAGMSKEPGTVTWYNIDDFSAHAGVGKDLMVVALAVQALCPDGGYAPIADAYIFIGKSTFQDIVEGLSDNSIISILDEKGKLVSSNKKEQYTEIESNIDIMTKIFSSHDGLFETRVGEGKYLFSHYSSSITGFKFIKIYDYAQHYRGVYSIAFLAVLLIGVLLVLVAFLYAVISKSITKPIKELSNTMKNFNDSDLYTRLPVEGLDEVAMITAGFNKMTERIHDMIENAKVREREKNDADFRALRYQINPHFLYNTLATIRIMAIKNQQKEISDIMLVLNRVLKNAFSKSDTYLPFSEEIALVKDYSGLLNLRYKNLLEITYGIREDTLCCYVPTMLIQPLVENAVMHGLIKRLSDYNGHARIHVCAEKKAGYLLIKVADNGIGMRAEEIEKALHTAGTKNHGVGLYNIRERIRILFGAAYGIEIQSEPEKYTVVILKLPIQEKEPGTE